MQYALAASCEALEDAGWHPDGEHEKEMTVGTFWLYRIAQALNGNREYALAQVSAALKNSMTRPSHMVEA